MHYTTLSVIASSSCTNNLYYVGSFVITSFKLKAEVNAHCFTITESVIASYEYTTLKHTNAAKCVINVLFLVT